MMPSGRLALLLAGSALLSAAHGAPAPLHVLRVSPLDGAARTSQITVTFDRPVAGALDASVDPARVLRVEPKVPGKLEWRDPVTIRLTPSAPLVPNATYTVTVSTDFQAMDASRLAEPYRWSFRVQGTTLVGGVPVRAGIQPQHVAPDQQFNLVYTNAVDLARLSSKAYAEFESTCSGARVVRLRAARQRAIANDDDWQLQGAGGWERDRSIDSLRRVVTLVPEGALPRGCGGELVVPSDIAANGDATATVRLAFHTYGDLRLTSARCAGSGEGSDDKACPTGPIRLEFSTPVKGAEVMRRVSLIPATPFQLYDTASVASEWVLDAKLKPRTSYAVVVDTAMRDVFGQRITGNPAAGAATTGYSPFVDYPYGRLLVERAAFRTLAVRHVNVDTLIAFIAPVPDSLEALILSQSPWSMDELWQSVRPRATVQRIPVTPSPDRVRITGIKLPLVDTRGPDRSSLLALRVLRSGVPEDSARGAPVAVLQVTDLGVHAKLGVEEGVVWVTGASDGRPRAGAGVTLYDADGKVLTTARTDSTGIARLTNFLRASGSTATAGDEEEEEGGDYEGGFQGYVAAELGDDRAVTGVRDWDPDLSLWQFNVDPAYGSSRSPQAAAVFTERGIYRPGEMVFAKAIVRRGALGALRVPARGDSLRWVFADREGTTLREATVPLSSFGTAAHTFTVPADAQLGDYAVKAQAKRRGTWRDVAYTSYRVAEYRPPEFLVEVSAEGGTADAAAERFPGDTVRATVQARYLFGAPMGRAAVTWMARQRPLYGWELNIPGTDSWYVGESGRWWEERDSDSPGVSVFESGVDTLDASGRRTLRVGLPVPPAGRGAEITVQAAITDVNRQVVGASTRVRVHPAAFYLAAKPMGGSYFWTAGEAQRIAVVAVRPGGERVSGIPIRGTIVRREWHRTHREREGVAETVGEWVSDTVARCTITSAAEPATCGFTPAEGGSYIVIFEARDARGRTASTSFYRWASGKGWVPWSDESQFKMDVVADRERYSVGDTATVMFASPFTDVEAWITVEREGLIEQRRMRLTSGATTLKLPITEAYAPNAFVAILVARGRSAKPGGLDDPGRPTIRVGYAELRVTPEVKRLAVQVEPLSKEYRPGDTARVAVRVRDAAGRGQASEVTLWAVDQGVLSLTGYRTPDPIDLLYHRRGLGMRLASNLTTVAPQVPEGDKGRAPGGGGGANGAEILRSRFKTTAFFMGSVVTDAQGNATASAKLPDNLTTFRVMAVAVTAGDRYGKGESPMLVTRPIVARPALPRFLRPGDEFIAGAVVNERAGGTPTVTVKAEAKGVELRGDATQRVRLEAGRGREVRFPFRASGDELRADADSVSFRFDATSGRDADAVLLRLAVRPNYSPRAHTVAGVLVDSAMTEIGLPAGTDPARSRLSITFGTTPLAVIQGAQDALHVYPYYCTEQVVSTALPLVMLHRAGKALGTSLTKGDPRRDLETAVRMLSGRQRADGGIGYWSPTDWTTPWLSAYAARVLLEARAVGVPVRDSVIGRLGDYLERELKNATPMVRFVSDRYDESGIRLADRVAAVDALRRLQRPDVAAENELARQAAQMRMEDRMLLAELLARRGDRQGASAARQLLEPMWAAVRVEGRRATLPDASGQDFYFASRLRPTARLLRATVAVDPSHPLVAPLVETMVQRGRAEALYPWNTQDYGQVVLALAEMELRQRAAGTRSVTVRAGDRVLYQGPAARSAALDSGVSLSGLLGRATGADILPLRVTLAASAPGVPIYYFANVDEVPLKMPVAPEDQGIRVERWFERFEGADHTPIASATEGELVRVRIRVTVPADRQFVVVDDPLPAGLEAVDLSLRTATTMSGPGAARGEEEQQNDGQPDDNDRGWYGSWDAGWWSPFDHKEIRDDRVVYFATTLWKGTYTATYVARATTPGVFVRPPAHAEEMYNRSLQGRSDGGTFTVRARTR